MTYVIAEPCVGKKNAACVTVCPVDCIYDSANHFFISPDECIDCAACEPVCPVQAIFPAENLPQQWSHYLQIAHELAPNSRS